MGRSGLPSPLLLLLPLLLTVSVSSSPHGYFNKRACYVNGSVIKCRSILFDCHLLENCHHRGVCALTVSNDIKCLPKSTWDFKKCGPEKARKSQPCPPDASIVGFGSGCNYCKRDSVGGQKLGRACVTSGPELGCRDISSACSAKSCRADQVCAVSVSGSITCLPYSVKMFQFCGSEEDRLLQPCPADAAIRGFGAGCTFCKGSDPLTIVLPTPEPASTRACVYRHIGNLVFKKECVDISTQCRQRMCPKNTVCGLDLQEKIKCFPQSVKEFENCRSESFRLQQPCPADSGIRGFGEGCTFCVGGFPLGEPTPSSTPTTVPAVKRACVVRSIGGRISKRECLDISVKCEQQMCPNNTLCGLDLLENIKCFPQSVKEFENCRSESFRLEQPCPADSGIRGFGEGCTFCVAGNPFVEPTPSPTPTNVPAVKRACVVRSIGGSISKRECLDISVKCEQQMCPNNTVCGLDLQENIKCFPGTVKEFENCRSESFRLQQPCPADSGIRGFGEGCTFCVAGNPFVEPTPSPTPMTVTAVKRACVVRYIGGSVSKRECLDISVKCKQRMCPNNTVCGLDLLENIMCFPQSVKEFENCRSESFRLQQPCPADSGIRGFGEGCTFCVAGNPFVEPTPSPTPTNVPAVKRACVVRYIGGSVSKRECLDISVKCKQLMCPNNTVCGLDLQENIKCFPGTVKEFENCRSESFRLQQPCPADSGIRGFGEGCTFCVGGYPFVEPTPSPTPTTGPAVKKACVVRHIGGGISKRECFDISDKCKQQMCPNNTVCGLDLLENIKCFPQSVKYFENCRSESSRLRQPCPVYSGIRGFGEGCTFCVGGGWYDRKLLP